MIGEAVGRALGAAVRETRRVVGGDLNEAFRAELEDGRVAFVKTRDGADAAEYANEAAGLRWLAGAPGGVPVPEVLGVGGDDAPFLALAWVEPGRLDGAAGAEALGRGLAALHRTGAPAAGAPPPGARDGVLRLGPLALPAAEGGDWAAFYAEHRLLAVLPHAGLDAGGRRAVERVVERLPELAGPPEPPARLHGDLWSGNVLAGADGRPRLIDPAAHGGHREVDLAMLQLFGAPSPRTLAAYDEVHPRAAGHAVRVPLWQLFPLLVHAALFGGSYRASVREAARRAAP